MFALKALNGVVPGFEKAKLRNFGMTIGTRDSREDEFQDQMVNRCDS